MNAPGIPVFYGAFDKNTCVAEVRALVGGKVVVSKFELLRNIRLLDFDALSEVDDGGSYLDPGYAERRGRAAFFKWLVGEISRPVMPQDEVFEHIPTQAMAEYLASKASPPLDGIIFRSSQTGGMATIWCCSIMHLKSSLTISHQGPGWKHTSMILTKRTAVVKSMYSRSCHLRGHKEGLESRNTRASSWIIPANLPYAWTWKASKFCT